MKNFPAIRKLLIAVPCALLIGTTACYFDNEEELLVCFPTEVSFRESVLPILQARC